MEEKKKGIFIFRKIGFKIAALFLLFALLPFLATGFLGNYFFNQLYLPNISNVESNLLEQKSKEIKLFFEDISSAMQFSLVGTGATKDLVSVKNFQLNFLQEILGGFYETERAVVLEASMSDELGNEIFKVSPQNFEVFQRSIDRSRPVPAEDPLWYPKMNLENISGLPEYEVVKSGKSYFGEIEQSLSGPLVRVSSPIVNQQGTFIGFVSANISVKKIYSSVQQSVLGDSGYLVLVNGDGMTLTDSGNKFSHSVDLSEINIVKDLKGGITRSGREQADQYLSYFGEEVIGASARLPEFDLGLVAEWPRSDAFSVLNTLKNQFWIAILFTFLVMIVIGFLISKRITKPIKILQQRAKEIGEGNFEQTIPIKTGDELEELGHSFEDMSKGLKELNELKDEFVFIATHELRTPVTVIKGYVSMLEEEAENLKGDTMDYVQKTKMANDRLVQLVDDLLEVARSQAGKMKISVEPTDILPDIEYTISEIKSLADKRGINIVHEKLPEFPKVMADSFRVKEVMVNLLSNAVKYNKEKGTITVSYDVKDGFLTIHVKDTGIGMSPEEVGKLFSKFYRAENKIVREIQGTGLGMFIVKNIVEKMGGKIWAESEWEKGTTFSFTLKIVVDKK
jgi:signal transduction histidine kinase